MEDLLEEMMPKLRKEAQVAVKLAKGGQVGMWEGEGLSRKNSRVKGLEGQEHDLFKRLFSRTASQRSRVQEQSDKRQHGK